MRTPNSVIDEADVPHHVAAALTRWILDTDRIVIRVDDLIPRHDYVRCARDNERNLPLVGK